MNILLLLLSMAFGCIMGARVMGDCCASSRAFQAEELAENSESVNPTSSEWLLAEIPLAERIAYALEQAEWHDDEAAAWRGAAEQWKLLQEGVERDE